MRQSPFQRATLGLLAGFAAIRLGLNGDPELHEVGLALRRGRLRPGRLRVVFLDALVARLEALVDELLGVGAALLLGLLGALRALLCGLWGFVKSVRHC